MAALQRQNVRIPFENTTKWFIYSGQYRQDAIKDAQVLRSRGEQVELMPLTEQNTREVYETYAEQNSYSGYYFLHVGDRAMRYLTFALGKGRLANKNPECLKKYGITCEEMKDKDTRKLIFVNEDLKLRFFLSKGPDVPTYVEYGAADIGIVGRDTILQEARNIYEVLDLGFGKCRMCVCGPESARDLLQHHEQIRVATKYPKIAKDYFYNKKHQTVEIIKLNGSIELAPIVGLADVIVDIVETGSTLRENGLTVLEEVCPLSARMVVNPVSMKMEQERIGKLISDLREVMNKGEN